MGDFVESEYGLYIGIDIPCSACPALLKLGCRRVVALVTQIATSASLPITQTSKNE